MEAIEILSASSGFIKADKHGSSSGHRAIPRGRQRCSWPHYPTVTEAGCGSFGVEKSSYTDETCMAMALATSLLEENSFNALAIMNEFRLWYREGKYSPSGRCDDIGVTTSQAIQHWETNQAYSYSGRTEINISGNGGVMRLAPIVIWNRHIYEDALVDAVRQSMLTPD